MLKIGKELLDEVSARAMLSPRRRMNHNFHTDLGDPVQRLLNALEPWTYIRPHYHTGKEESFVLLRGKVLAVTFNEDGSIRDHSILSGDTGIIAIEFEEGCYHMLTSLESGSVVFELKEGPFIPHSEPDSAPWAPAEGSSGVKSYLTGIFQRLGIEPPPDDQTTM